MNSRFEYIPLQEGEIRLVRVVGTKSVALSGSASTGITVEIQTFSRNILNPKYTALSYRWGSSKAVILVQANGQQLHITSNLHSFLREVHLRQCTIAESEEATLGSSPWFKDWLWIDAICIDQDNVSEKNEQVRKMKEIYKNAFEIIIWLRTTLDDADEVTETLESIASLELDDEEQGTSLSLTDGELPGVSCKLSNSDDYVEMLYTTLFDIADILNDEYWTRTWIIQEASTPKDTDKIQICFKDNNSIAWSTLAGANQRLLLAAANNKVPEHADLNGIANSDIATVNYIQDRRASRAYEEPLYTMLVRCRTSVASDPRDKVYAILGMTQQNHEAGLQADYALDTAKVYQLAAKTIIETTRSLDCLGSAYLLQQSSMPSWVPDWTAQHSIVPQPFYQYEMLWQRNGSLRMRRNLFQAGSVIEPEFVFSEDGKRLSVRGFLFDSVNQLSLPRHRPGDISSSEVWTSWRDVAKLGVPGLYVSNCSRAQAFEKVLRADISEVWGDWSAERGYIVDEHVDTENLFEAGDPILDALTWNRRLFYTEKGYLGLGPDQLQVGDVIGILFGSQMPIILRQQATTWLCIGQAYVHGLMDGEAVEHCDKADWRIFTMD